MIGKLKMTQRRVLRACVVLSAILICTDPVLRVQVEARASPAQVDSLVVHEAAIRALRTHRDAVLEYPIAPVALVVIPHNYLPRQLAMNGERSDAARPRLIATLDSLGALNPGSLMIIGHRVGHRFLLGDFDDALDVARDCEAVRWWCRALEGFVLHQMARFEEAESAFDEARTRMPVTLRCQWQEDMRAFMEPELADEFQSNPCLDRIELEDRFWRLSDPFYLMPGNDRRTEHFARMVAWEMWEYQDGVNLNFIFRISRDTWSVALANRTAHGWPWWWWDFAGQAIPVTDLPGYAFVPSLGTMNQATASSRPNWALALRTDDVVGYGDTRRVSRFGDRQVDGLVLRNFDWDDRYLPSYTIHEDLSDQTAFFARGDSFAVAAATDLRSHPLAIRRPLDVGIVLLREDLDEPTIAWGEEVGVARYLFRAMIPAEAHLVSIEALSGQDAAARVRFGHGLPSREGDALGLSDLLLFEWQEDLPDELDAVAPHMLGSTRITGNDAVGLYWEMYGLEDAAGLEVSVTVQRQDAGFFRRLGQALRLVGERDGPSVRWEEGERDEEVAGRTLRLDLSGLEAGQYVLELEVGTQDGREAEATREFVRVGG